MGWLALCLRRLLLPLLLTTAAALLLGLLAWRLLLRNRLPRWLKRHITGLQVLVSPQLALRVQSVGLESAAFEWRGKRLCWVIRGVRASLGLREGAVGDQKKQQQQARADPSSTAHDAAAGTCAFLVYAHVQRPPPHALNKSPKPPNPNPTNKQSTSSS